MDKLNQHKNRLEEILDMDYKDDGFDTIEDEVIAIESDVNDYCECPNPDKIVKEIFKLIREIKEEFSFYDPEAELEMMFPENDY